MILSLYEFALYEFDYISLHYMSLYYMKLPVIHNTNYKLVTNVIIQSIPNDSRAFVMIKLNPLTYYRGGAFAFNC